MRKAMIRTWLLTLASLLSGVPLLQAQESDLDRLKRKQNEVRKLLEEIERAVQAIRPRLEKKNPEEAKRLAGFWKAMQEQLIQEDMQQVEEMFQSGNLLGAIRKIDEVIEKLQVVLRKLLGGEGEKKAESPRLPEIRRALEGIIRKQERVRDALKELREKTTGRMDELAGRIGRLIRQQAALKKETGKVPDKSLIELLEEILERVVRLGRAQEKWIGNPEASPEEEDRLRKEAEGLEPVMEEAFRKIHAHGGALAHKFGAAREHVRSAAKAMGRATEALRAAGGDAGTPMKEARAELKTAEELIREILHALEGRRARLPELAREQAGIQGEIERVRREAEELSKGADGPEGQALKDAAGALREAAGLAGRAGESLGKGSPGEAGPAQAGAKEGLEKAKEAVERARRAKERNLGREDEAKIRRLKEEQERLKEEASDLARKLGEGGAAEKVRSAGEDMGSAASKMGGGSSPGGNPQGGGGRSGRDMGAAQKDQEEAVRKLKEARDEVKQREREEMLGALEARLLRMIKKQKEINKTTVELHTRKETMGELTRMDKLRILKPAAEEQAKLSETATECKGIAEASGAVEIGWAFGMVATEMKEVAKLLDGNETGELTQRKERFILRMLEGLLQAVREKKQEAGGQAGGPQGKSGGDSGGGGPESEGEQQPGDEVLGVEAELRMLIELQRHLKWQTEELGRKSRGRQEFKRTHRDIVEELKVRQAELIERLGNVISRMQGKTE